MGCKIKVLNLYMARELNNSIFCYKYGCRKCKPGAGLINKRVNFLQDDTSFNIARNVFNSGDIILSVIERI
ncbi:hypothetical protein GCM10022210_16680 [Mucilaginibacter dorajii]|uniref:Uncharacterized protein n=1 Tax=Mucilaginibacter dorajii TaxID=692994 RepID=A0ABP7PP28_9SPHI